MSSKHCKHIVDVLLGVGLLLLMSYQVTGEAGHEWTGIVMTLLMILHQILNRKWYAALFKGKYTPLRTVQTLVNAALVICFVLTALCGVNMSVHAVPFLSEFMRASVRAIWLRFPLSRCPSSMSPLNLAAGTTGTSIMPAKAAVRCSSASAAAAGIRNGAKKPVSFIPVMW